MGIMFKRVLFTVVALTGLTVSAPAQLRVQVQLGRSAIAFGDLARHHAPATRRYAPRARTPRLSSPRWVQAPRRYTTVQRRVWVPGYYEIVSVPARYGWTVNLFGVRIWGMVAPACSRRVLRSGQWAHRTQRVLVRRY